MGFHTLIQAAELRRHLGDPHWRVVDCRFELSDVSAGERAWRQGHIPGAVFADLERDLSSHVTATSGRHPLPAADEFAATLGRLGIGNDTQVVAYDAGPGMYAARLWWMLRWLGHPQVAVLDGGYRAWCEQGADVETTPVNPPPQSFIARPRPDMQVDALQVSHALAAGQLLVDARGPARFAGATEPIDAVAGHVPGAVNVPFEQNLAADGRFLPADELRRRWLEVLDGQDPGSATCMCGSGVTACHDLLAMQHAGLPGARLYAGSWSEWIRDPARPVARDLARPSGIVRALNPPQVS